MATRSIVAMLVTVVAIGVITLLLYPIYAIAAEDMGAVASLKKGMETAKCNFWKTLGLFALMLVLSLVISLIIGFLIGIVSVPLPAQVCQVMVALVNAAVQSYIPIVMMVAFMSYYLSLSSGQDVR